MRSTAKILALPVTACYRLPPGPHQKLGDAASDPRYILTEPRVGYRMAMEGHEGSSLSSRETAAPGADDVV